MSTVEAQVKNPDDLALEYTLGARLKLAKEILSKGINESDPKDISNALKALDGVDKQVINKKRLVIEDRAANENAKAAKLISEVLMGIGNHKPYEATQPVERDAPTLPDNLPPLDLVPGETEIYTQQDSMEDFMRRRGLAE